MDLANLIGTLAGVFTTIAFLPQVIKTWKTQSSNDISLLMFLSFSGGVLLWLVYGVMQHAMPIIIANSITLILSGLILVFKVKDLRAQRRRQLAADRRSL